MIELERVETRVPGAELARATFAPLLREPRLPWGAERFDAARAACEAARRATRG